MKNNEMSIGGNNEATLEESTPESVSIPERELSNDEMCREIDQRTQEFEKTAVDKPSRMARALNITMETLGAILKKSGIGETLNNLSGSAQKASRVALAAAVMSNSISCTQEQGGGQSAEQGGGFARNGEQMYSGVQNSITDKLNTIRELYKEIPSGKEISTEFVEQAIDSAEDEQPGDQEIQKQMTVFLDTIASNTKDSNVTENVNNLLSKYEVMDTPGLRQLITAKMAIENALSENIQYEEDFSHITDPVMENKLQCESASLLHAVIMQQHFEDSLENENVRAVFIHTDGHVQSGILTPEGLLFASEGTQSGVAIKKYGNLDDNFTPMRVLDAKLSLLHSTTDDPSKVSQKEMYIYDNVMNQDVQESSSEDDNKTSLVGGFGKAPESDGPKPRSKAEGISWVTGSSQGNTSEQSVTEQEYASTSRGLTPPEGGNKGIIMNKIESGIRNDETATELFNSELRKAVEQGDIYKAYKVEIEHKKYAISQLRIFETALNDNDSNRREMALGAIEEANLLIDRINQLEWKLIQILDEKHIANIEKSRGIIAKSEEALTQMYNKLSQIHKKFDETQNDAQRNRYRNELTDLLTKNRQHQNTIVREYNDIWQFSPDEDPTVAGRSMWNSGLISLKEMIKEE